MPSKIDNASRADQIFVSTKGIFSSSCNLLKNLFTKQTDEAATKTLKIIFHDFPGGAVGFELFSRFCYNSGGIFITPANTYLLHCAACFMEMTKESSSLNLIKKTEKSIEGIAYWSWLDIAAALKQCQDCFLDANYSAILDKVLDFLVGRITSGSDTSPTSSSPESSAFRFSFDTRSTFSAKHISSRSWWFEDIAVMNAEMIEKVVKTMISHKVDHAIISRFLFYNLRSRVTAASMDKKKSAELVVNLLYCLDKTSISYRGLFGVLMVCSSLKIRKLCQDRLESMIGSQLDQATLDNLLIPSPTGMDSLYDVNIIIRFLKSFFATEVQVSITQLKRVANLIDLYLAEVAPDSSLKPSKFIALITALPDAVRDSYDAIYQAIDMFLENLQYNSLQSKYEGKHFVARRESPWKVDSDSSGVSSKLKLLEQALGNLENIGQANMSKIPSLMRKQAKRYKSLISKIDDLCQRMQVNESCNATLSPGLRTQQLTEFLLEAFRLHHRATETRQN